MKSFIVKLLISTLIIPAAMAKVKVTKVDYKNDGEYGVVTVSLKGKLRDTPELTIKDKIVQIAIPDSFVWPKVEKQVSVVNSFDSTIMAYQFSKNLVRVRANLPYSVKGKEGKVSVVLGDDNIKLYFPKTASKAKRIVKSIVAPKKKVRKTAKAYDESYLEKLLKDKEQNKGEKVEKLQITKKETKTDLTDKVKSSLSGIKKGGFNFSTYVFKFIGFFSLLVAGIYFIMNFFRKGFLKKGSLGFLTGTKMVEVLNTTYLGPKRSLLVVKVHNQVFLMAQSEKGMDFLTEIKDTTAFFKEGEKVVNGSNFDTNLNTANDGAKEFKLKEVVSELGNKKEEKALNEADYLLKTVAQSEDKVSLASQIKSKIKDLKPLQ